MKKMLVFMVVIVMMFALAASAFASEVSISGTNSTIKGTADEIDGLSVSLPSKSLGISAKYTVLPWLDLEGSYDKGQIQVVSSDINVNQDEWKIGVSAHKQFGSFNLTGFAGYGHLDNDLEIDGTIGSYLEIDGTIGSLEVEGLYAGITGEYTLEKVVLGATYTQYINPDGTITSEYLEDSVDVDSNKYSIDIYGKIAISKNIDFKAGYFWSVLNVSVDGFDVDTTNSGIKVSATYKF